MEVIAPQQGKQLDFLSSPADISIYGGSAGSGKSFAMLLDPLRGINDPNFTGVIFRKNYPQLRVPGGLIQISHSIYPLLGGVYNSSMSEWVFPSGARIVFRHLQHDNTHFNYQGAQFTFIGFDELTHFTKESWVYLLSRNRGVSGFRPWMRGTCNPDAESWLLSWIDWWIDEEGYPIPDRSGVVRHFVNINDKLIWADTSDELRSHYPCIEPKSFTFIPAKIQDNPILLEKDPGYLANLHAQHPVDMARLLLGNWRIKFESGKVFDRQWFEIVNYVPDGSDVRFWDLAATERDVVRAKEPCYTAGVKMRRVGNVYYILDLIAEQMGPGDIDNLIWVTAIEDGHACAVRWEMEGGSAGIRDAAHLSNLLNQFDAQGVRPQGDKITRAKPWATSAKMGRVKLLAGDWNNRFLSWCQSFPASGKDCVDATSGAYAVLSDSSFNWLDALVG